MYSVRHICVPSVAMLSLASWARSKCVCVVVNEQFEFTVIVVQRSAGAPSVVNGTSFWPSGDGLRNLLMGHSPFCVASRLLIDFPRDEPPPSRLKTHWHIYGRLWVLNELLQYGITAAHNILESSYCCGTSLPRLSSSKACSFLTLEPHVRV